ncbi:hypothetical protein EWH70_30760 [Amycolatopsis suaedae]|uniref:Uncharacterized protein n=1 Tax=Amycolatopsis suaedae TaxID=2510978 RepID=A0A4V2EL25_9PSEU|nr:hypothetical protein EWH70_30760 [Amycolatopsis suaedae]
MRVPGARRHPVVFEGWHPPGSSRRGDDDGTRCPQGPPPGVRAHRPLLLGRRRPAADRRGAVRHLEDHRGRDHRRRAGDPAAPHRRQGQPGKRQGGPAAAEQGARASARPAAAAQPAGPAADAGPAHAGRAAFPAAGPGSGAAAGHAAGARDPLRVHSGLHPMENFDGKRFVSAKL